VDCGLKEIRFFNPQSAFRNLKSVKARVCDGGLSERDAAIIRRHATVRKDLKAITFEHPAHIFEKKHVLKDPSR